MLTIQTTPLQTFAVLAALAAFSIFYNDVFVENLARHLPAKFRATSFEVVFGVFVTCVGIGVILGLPAMLVCLLCFAASGLRMIWGDIRRTEVLG
jgi:hypothetical protein